MKLVYGGHRYHVVSDTGTGLVLTHGVQVSFDRLGVDDAIDPTDDEWDGAHDFRARAGDAERCVECGQRRDPRPR
jgi:hypothetical protein